MSKTIHYDSKFLESTDNLKRVVKKSLGLELNSEVARGATICLQHGRLYFEAAEKSPLEIKPLLIFYGILNYLKGLVIARNLVEIEAFKRHGISDMPLQTRKLEELRVKCNEQEGDFHIFNDSVCKLDCVDYKNTRLNSYDYITIPAADSNSLKNRKFTLKDILARIHRLAPLYSATFDEDAKTISSIQSNIDKKLTTTRDEDLQFDNRSGTYFSKEDGLRYCHNCFHSTNKKVPLKEQENGWRCNACGKFFPNPNYERQSHADHDYDPFSF